MTADKDIGRLEGKMDLVLDHLSNMQATMDKITTEGCIKGTANEKAIAALQRRTVKTEGLVTKLALIVAVSAGSGAGIAKMIESLWQ